MLSEEILALNDAQVERVSVPEWGALGERVYVRVFDGSERDRWERRIVACADNREAFYENVRAHLVQMTACDERGELIFNPEQVVALSKKSAPALQRIYDVAFRLNKLGKSDLEELEKNSASATSAVSGLGSQRTSESQSGNASAK